MFSCEFCKFSKSIFPYKTPLVAASRLSVVRNCLRPKTDPLKDLRNYILRIIRVLSLLFALRPYRSLYFLLITLGNQFFVFLCFLFLSVLNFQFDVVFVEFINIIKYFRNCINHCLHSALWPSDFLFTLRKLFLFVKL